MAIVSVEGYSFWYPAGDAVSNGSCGGVAPVLDNVSLQVEQGAFCVLAGPTGCGKTTLLRSLKPELVPVGRYEGSVEVLGARVIDEGRQTGALSVRESAAGIGFVMQDPGAQIVCDSVWHELAFGLENLGMPQDEMRRRVAEVAHVLGIGPWMHEATETLSGGQKQLVNLAGVLALQPRLLLLDEPTAQLDPNACREFVFMLSRVNRELGVTVVMATHMPEEVEAYATQRVDLGPSCPSATRAEVERAIDGRWRKASGHPAGAPCCAECRDAHVRYDRGAPWVLGGVDVRVTRGSVHAFVGGNGCGKTTLLRLLAGILRPQRGRVSNSCTGSQAYLPQDPKALFVCDSVAEELAEWCDRCGYAPDDELATLRRFGLAGLERLHPYDLSGGQQQRLALAKLMLCGPQLLLLDEPTKGLDPQSRAQTALMLRGLAGEGRTVVLATHDLDFALAAAGVVSLVFDGPIACTEPAGEFFAHSMVYRPSDRSRFYGALLELLGGSDEPGGEGGHR